MTATREVVERRIRVPLSSSLNVMKDNGDVERSSNPYYNYDKT